MIQIYYCEEKLDAGQSKGSKVLNNINYSQ